MRFVVKPEDTITDGLASEKTYKALKKIVEKEGDSSISANIYKEPYDDGNESRSRVADQLAVTYHHKCAYCERIAKADIEHYRPKGRVLEDDDHSGYYWLCYEWTKLIPSCVK